MLAIFQKHLASSGLFGAVHRRACGLSTDDLALFWTSFQPKNADNAAKLSLDYGERPVFAAFGEFQTILMWPQGFDTLQI